VRRHHTYVREQLPVIAARLAKLVSVHGERHPELASASQHVAQLEAELRMHMLKEEEILFPYIRALSLSVDEGRPAPPNMFGTVRNPIRMMEAEHQAAGDELARLREITSGFRTPGDACATYRVCYQELGEFDADLRRHIHLENNVLFPMAVALEARSAVA
jgi:regulator of cell morphogenesis and NO signaling